MKLYIKDTAQGGDTRFLIYDELGYIKYKVTIKHTALTCKLDVYDSFGKRVAKIRARDIVILRTYSIAASKTRIKVIGRLTDAVPAFSISGISWLFRGDIVGRNFDIINVDKSVVANHCARWGSFGSGYEVNITDPGRGLLCICVCLCIDTLVMGDIKFAAIQSQ